MFPTFFKHKMREVRSFLKIMRGKATGNDEVRKQGVNDALNAMKDEKKVYLNEKEDAKRGVDSDVKVRNNMKKSSGEERDKVIRESGEGQDISAI